MSTSFAARSRSLAYPVRPRAWRALAWSTILTTPALAQAVRVPDAPAAIGLVNAPVAPEAIYIGRAGSVSVIDLNGFGQGTGDLRNTSWPRNPNLGRFVYPPLSVGSSSLNAGGAGALTLTRDHFGSDEHLRLEVGSIDDLHLGQPLDLVFNTEHRNRFTRMNQVNPATMTVMPGNTISVAPHPNPPRLIAPPLAPEVGIWGEEPTTTSSETVPGRVTTNAPPALSSPINLLLPGNPFSQTDPGIFGARYDGIFVGPQPPPSATIPIPWAPYSSRQQVGHFLYAVDRTQRRVHAVNSNRFTILQSFALPDPYSAAMAPNLRWLAVSNFARDTVSFLDVDPLSPTFHRVLGEIAVGRGPTGLAWQPQGEDLLVCNSLDNSVSIISAATFQVRKTLRTGITRPMDVAVVTRQAAVGLNTWTYAALVRNGDGTLATYESGPMPFGPDDSAPLGLGFIDATVVQARLTGVTPEFWVAHRDANGLGQVSLVALGVNGTQRVWSVTQRYGGLNATTRVRDFFSGNAIVDLAFEETHNDGASPDVPSPLPGLTYARHSGKGQLKQTATGPIPAHRSLIMFAACSDVDRVDVVQISTGQRLTSIAVPQVHCLSHYWRQ